MTTIKDILEDIDNNNEYIDNDKYEKYRIIATKRANIDVENFIFDTLENLEIEVTKRKVNKVKPLVYADKLDGYCWESTEAMSVFFEDAYIVRGYLVYNEENKYYHSWLVISYKGELYVFDPTANIIALKRDFDNVFIVQELAIIPSNLVHNELIKVLEGKVKEYTPKFKDKETNDEVIKFGKLLSSILEVPDFGKEVPYSDDILAPFYRNTSAYKGEIENNKIKSLRVHFYDYDA